MSEPQRTPPVAPAAGPDSIEARMLRHLRMLCVILWVGAAVVWVRGPAVTGKQLAFRLAIAGVALVVSVAVAVAFVRSKKRDGASRVQ